MDIILNEDDILSAITLYLMSKGLEPESVMRRIGKDFIGNSNIVYDVSCIPCEKIVVLDNSNKDYIIMKKEDYKKELKDFYREGYAKGLKKD